MADGLACAHAAGIVHRDLKPGNVMVTDGEHVKILDFGVAKIRRADLDVRSRAPHDVGRESSGGRAVGTAGYMSPEQALGRPVDARADLFALGVVLFEMATGRTPFQGDTAAAVFDQLLNRLQPSLLTLNPTLPRSLDAIIDKALEKDPDRRYRIGGRALSRSAGRGCLDRSAGERRGDRHRAGPFVLDRRSAFRRSESWQGPGVFCHGITEEIINALTGVPGVRVISRTSAFAFLGKDIEVTEIGRRLRVETVLEGSVRKAGDRVRVLAQLVSAGDGYQIGRSVSSASSRTSSRFRTRLPRASWTNSGSIGTEHRGSDALNVPAHDAYLKGCTP